MVRSKERGNEKLPVPETFEEQFCRREKIKVEDGLIEIVDIWPEHLKSQVPVLFAPGWSITTETMKDTIRVEVGQGRRVLALSHAREGGDLGGVDPELRQEFPKDELRKALALLEIVISKKLKQVDVISHSEGGINSALAAYINPKLFRSIIFVDPAGLIGADRYLDLAKRFALELTNESLRLMREESAGARRERATRGRQESTKYFMKNPLRSLRETQAVARIRIEGLLSHLHSEGVRIGIMSNVDDMIFPVERMTEIVKKSILDAFVTVRGAHNEIYLNPEKIIPAADSLLDKLAEIAKV